MSPTAKRALFQTPSRTAKRTKTMTTRRAATRIPKSLMPEMKQFIPGIALIATSTNAAWGSIPTSLTQGDNSANFDGSKFRIARIRVMYDFSTLVGSATEGVRISVVIPKDPTAGMSFPANAHTPWDTTSQTVLHEILLPRDLATSAGTFDVTGPINCELNSTGTTPLRNDVNVVAQSAFQGAPLTSCVSYAVWFTG